MKLYLDKKIKDLYDPVFLLCLDIDNNINNISNTEQIKNIAKKCDSYMNFVNRTNWNMFPIKIARIIDDIYYYLLSFSYDLNNMTYKNNNLYEYTLSKKREKKILKENHKIVKYNGYDNKIIIDF